MTAARVLVVGGSVAGGACVAQLRNSGFLGEIVVIDGDSDAPYDRPPLSKTFLSATASAPEAPWADERHDRVVGEAVVVDPAARSVIVAQPGGGTEAVAGDHVVLATGSTPLQLPRQPEGVAELRTAADARLLRRYAKPGRRVIILGAGTIGTELASTLTAAGGEVALVDLAPIPLDRFLGGHLGDEATRWVRGGGVELHLDTRVAHISREGMRWRVETDGPELTGDLVVSAVGTRPTTDWLLGSGISVGDGVRCDANGAVLLEDDSVAHGIHAVGDVAAWYDGSEHRRHQDWTTAQRQGRHVAARILGDAAPLAPEPAYFWSDQFGRQIKVLGTPVRDGKLVQHTDVPDRRSAFYTVEGATGPSAWIAINSPREFALAMRDSLRASD